MHKEYIGKLKTSLDWWLSKKGFNINEEYKIDLLYIDRVNSSVKIRITNLKTGVVTTQMQEEVASND